MASGLDFREMKGMGQDVGSYSFKLYVKNVGLGQSNFKVYTIYWYENISRVPHRPNFQMKIASLSDEGSNESSVFRAFDRAFIRKASYFHCQMGVLFHR